MPDDFQWSVAILFLFAGFGVAWFTHKIIWPTLKYVLLTIDKWSNQ